MRICNFVLLYNPFLALYLSTLVDLVSWIDFLSGLPWTCLNLRRTSCRISNDSSVIDPCYQLTYCASHSVLCTDLFKTEGSTFQEKTSWFLFSSVKDVHKIWPTLDLFLPPTVHIWPCHPTCPLRTSAC